jgi:hypothetical protein
MAKKPKSYESTNPHAEPHPGRPAKWDEPTVRKQFELPVSINERLLEATKASPENPNGINQSDYMRDAILEKLDGKRPSLPADLRDVVRLAVNEILVQTGVAVPLAPKAKEDLEAVAKQLGYGEATGLLAAFAQWAAKHPAGAGALLNEELEAPGPNSADIFPKNTP